MRQAIACCLAEANRCAGACSSRPQPSATWAAGGGYPKRVDTGRLRASINTQLVVRGDRPIAVVGTNVRYARFVHDGTGIYGPRGRVIRPKRRKFLRFKPKGTGHWVYARKVRGMRPNPFLANALVAAKG